jgi:hypothetical protein
LEENVNQKVELGSAEWISLAGNFLQEVVPPLAEQLNDVKWSVCQVLTDPPAHLANTDSGKVAWWYNFEGAQVTTGSGFLDGADTIMEGDYRRVLPMARIVYSESAEMTARRQADHERINVGSQSASEAPAGDAAAPGKVPIPAPLRPTLLELHDHLARHTL